jgi:flagellar biosynthesis/type III secretory pathway chaperone
VSTVPHDQNAIDGLAQVLATECQAYARLVTLAHQEQTALRVRDVISLMQAMDNKRSVLASIQEMERSRLGFASGVARALDLGSDTGLLSVAARAAPAQALRLTSLRSEILGHVAHLSALNRQNAILLNSSLELTNAALNFISFGRGVASTYGPRGAPHAYERHTASIVVDRPA